MADCIADSVCSEGRFSFACAFEQSLAKLAFDGVPQSLRDFITQVVRPEPGRLLRNQVRDGADAMPIGVRLTPRPTLHDLVPMRSSKVAAAAIANMIIWGKEMKKCMKASAIASLLMVFSLNSGAADGPPAHAAKPLATIATLDLPPATESSRMVHTNKALRLAALTAGGRQASCRLSSWLCCFFKQSFFF